MYFLRSVNKIILPVNETGPWRSELHKFPLMEFFPARATAQGYLHREPFAGSGNPSSQGHLPQKGRQHLVWPWLMAFLHPREGWWATKWVSVSHLPLSNTDCRNEQVFFYDMQHMKSQRGKENLGIGKGIINPRDKCICHHRCGMSLPLLSCFLIYTEHKPLSFYGDMTQHWILAQAAQN